MGIVFKQTASNTLITYLGFGIGAINTLFLYTRFLTEEYFGLVGVILSTSTILMPILAFGVPNTMVKYYSSFRNTEDTEGFLTLMLLLPLLFIIPISAIAYFTYDVVGSLLSNKNAIVKDYVWHIVLIGLAMAYFEVFYAWAKVQMKSVFGNFMKEVFVRLGVTVLLIILYLDFITVTTFLKALVALYLLRTIIMKLYAYSLKRPRLHFKFPKNTSTILKYSFLIIIGGSTAVVLLEIDRFMINQFIKIENVAYYSVAIFIATVISVPARAMHQITYPLTAQILNEKDMHALKQLYQKSSLTLFLMSGLIFTLIVLNLNDLYALLPETYSGGLIVVVLIGLAKVFDALLGNNNSILYNSDHYRWVLLMGVFLALLTIGLNLWLIPVYGLNGAALATFLAIGIYNMAKFFYVRSKFGIQPLTLATFKVVCLLLLVGILFYIVPFTFHPVLNILLKSTALVIIYFWVLLRFNISDDVHRMLLKFLKR
ncbi:lipopolysaccharide biosynthesis protein [Spongiimicrobium sp. 3-5]|uniref:lipopolysaccharide biosynthesis protein n=1 Tax=Spongiimicrobium sp. 3-5 TaxID=3332596 RepID=UPI00398144EA